MKIWFRQRLKLLWLAVWLRTTGRDREGSCVPLRGLRGLQVRVKSARSSGDLPVRTARRLNRRIDELVLDLFDECRLEHPSKPAESSG